MVSVKDLQAPTWLSYLDIEFSRWYKLIPSSRPVNNYRISICTKENARKGLGLELSELKTFGGLGRARMYLYKSIPAC